MDNRWMLALIPCAILAIAPFAQTARAADAPAEPPPQAAAGPGAAPGTAAAALAGEKEESPIDFARSRFRDAWLHHPAVGDPSWDTFEREAGNPIHTGGADLPWAVNGFLFRDPPTGRWYAFVGLYPQGYWSAATSQKCLLLRERSGGGWEEAGIVLEGDPKAFDGDGKSPGGTPDVSVVFDGGAYHMVYDWANRANTRGGLGYARAERPEGPWRRAPEPIHDDAAQEPILGRYVRSYAGTLLRRERDWIVLHMMSTPGNGGGTWALACMSAPKPEGPWSRPKILLAPQSDRFLPPLAEFFPAFAHAGSVWAPATSVARNRSYQAVFRASLEAAHEPGAWEIYQDGSLWHAEPRAAEALGIWGQTFSGQVSPDGTLRILYPSRTAGGSGTIHMARRPWERPYRDGFVLSAPNAPAVAILRREYGSFRLRITARSTGPWAIAWAARGPIGPDGPGADAAPDPGMGTDRQELRWTEGAWNLEAIDASGAARRLGGGPHASARGGEAQIGIERDGSRIRVTLDAAPLVEVEAADPSPGRLEIRAEAGAIVSVRRFELSGVGKAGWERWLSTEAVAGSGEVFGQWKRIGSPRFACGWGQESTSISARAKWNCRSRGFRLLAPRGPSYGAGEVVVDGQGIGPIDFYAAGEEPSRALLERQLPEGLHSIAIRSLTGTIPCDALEVLEPDGPFTASGWAQRYEPLESPEARRLLERAIAFGRRRLGEPAVPVLSIGLRRSVPIDKTTGLATGFQLTEMDSMEPGRFTIYLGAGAEEVAFAGQLAHEAFHLFNTRLRDVYVEGLNMLLAEGFLAEEGRPWELWLRHFQSGREPLYGGAYFLMREMAGEAGDQAMGTLLRFAVESPGAPDRREIDIDGWIRSLDPVRAGRARELILKRHEPLDAVRRQSQPDLAFRRPAIP